MKQIRIYLYIVAGISSLGLMSSCVSEGNEPGIEFAPNMYVSEAYEAYTQVGEMSYNKQYGGMTMRPPAEGTIARGQLDYYQYEEGYEASVDWANPLERNKENVNNGQVLYERNCAHCHGMTGKNDGSVVKNSEYPSPPWTGYDADYIKTLPDGKMFHTITFGKGVMGPHAPLLSPNERWQVVHYIRKLSLGDGFTLAEESVMEAIPTDSTVNMVTEEAVTEENAQNGHL